ncbi:MAG: hypothetical protein HQK50_09685 [Oligoflexia bacterium]|nr:hypothetical protein [Oligoflexia bacterium]MBF0365833.1 hypothetical protein [Oligoflexia bacterium]
MECSDYLTEGNKCLSNFAVYVGKFFGMVVYQSKKLNLSLQEGITQIRLDEFTGKLSCVKKLLPSGKRQLLNEASPDRDFYAHFGKDLIELSKANLKSENITIIDVSKYKL